MVTVFFVEVAEEIYAVSDVLLMSFGGRGYE